MGGFFIWKNIFRKVLYPVYNKRIIELDKERGSYSLLERGKSMIRRRFTTEEVWEKIDDFQGVICELLARYEYFSPEDEKHLENAADELTKVMYSLDDRL